MSVNIQSWPGTKTGTPVSNVRRSVSPEGSTCRVMSHRAPIRLAFAW